MLIVTIYKVELGLGLGLGVKFCYKVELGLGLGVKLCYISFINVKQSIFIPESSSS